MIRNATVKPKGTKFKTAPGKKKKKMQKGKVAVGTGNSIKYWGKRRERMAGPGLGQEGKVHTGELARTQKKKKTVEVQKRIRVREGWGAGSATREK